MFDDRRLRVLLRDDDEGNGGQISPNFAVISSIIDWLDSTRFSIRNEEWHDDGGVRRLTIELLSTFGDEHVQWESVNRIGIWWISFVERVDVVNDRSSWESLSNWSFGSKSETCWWKSKSKWDGMWWNVVVFTCVIEECGRICCIYERRIATGIELWHWR